MLGGSAFGASEALKKSVGEGEFATPKEIGLASAFGAGGFLIEPIFTAAKNFIKKIPRAIEAINSVVKSSGGKVTEEKILAEAAKNLEERGVSIVKAAEGDTATLNAIQKESIKVADTFEKAEKFNRKEIEKIRGEKAEKLVQSPLEEYYKPEKEVAHRPETLAKQAERIKPLEASIKQKERSLLNLQYRIIQSERSLAEGGANLSAVAKDRLEGGIRLDKMQHAKTLNDIRAAQFEIKYGHPPATTEEIQKQIAKSFEEIRAGIENPSAAKVAKLKKALEQNEKALHSAEKLLARGELPGPPVFDEFIKIKQEYVKAYGDLIEEIKSFVRDNKNVKAEASRVANARELQSIIEKTRDQAKASIVNQIDKRKALKTLSGPSGAMWKNLLKDVRTDVDAFKKDWIKVRKISSPLEEKTSKAAQEAVKGEKAAAKPLKGPEEVKASAAKDKADKSFKEELSNNADNLASKKTNEKDASKIGKAISNWQRRLLAIPSGIARGAVIGSLQALLEEKYDFKFPLGIFSYVLPGRQIGKTVSAFTGFKVHELVNDMFIEKEAKKLRSLRNTPEFEKYRRDLEDRYAPKRVKKIVKQATQSK